VHALTKHHQTATIPAMKTTPKLDGLQWGRAIACVAVVITHAIAHPLGAAPGAIHLLGLFGVTLFFIISGYIMVLTTGPGRFDPIDFMSRRLTRIVPIYYIATLTTAVLCFFAPNLFKGTIFDIPHLIKSLLFIPMYHPNGSGFIFPFYRLGWTLNFEVFFYVIFALTFWLSLRRRLVFVTLVFGVLITLGQLNDYKPAPEHFYTQIDTLAFVVGVWLAAFRTSVTRFAQSRAGLITLLIALLSLALMIAFYGHLRARPITQVWLTLACIPIIAGLISIPDAWFAKAPKWIGFIGDASYSVYLFHMFAISLVTSLTRRFVPEFTYPMMAVSALVGLGFGLLAYIWVERPIIGWFATRRALKRAVK
jgi:exopolysaccharide production protein ExoZ